MCVFELNDVMERSYGTGILFMDRIDRFVPGYCAKAVNDSVVNQIA